MDYKKYQVSRNLAWEILLREGITELPVKVGALCRSLGIGLKYYAPVDDNDGYSTIIGGRGMIFVSDRCIQTRQRFTAAHELGHILLGHVGKYQLVNREPSSKDNPIEQEANVFASRLLAPACVLWALNARTPEEIAALCQISYQAASYRADRLELLYKRNMFLSSPMEQEVFRQFLPFIRDRLQR